MIYFRIMIIFVYPNDRNIGNRLEWFHNRYSLLKKFLACFETTREFSINVFLVDADLV